jgi:hypothetical protein
MLIFTEEGKPENPEKNPRSKGEPRINNELNSHMTLTYDIVVLELQMRFSVEFPRQAV